MRFFHLVEAESLWALSQRGAVNLPQVKELQDKLRAAGFDPGVSDGWYGQRTANAVRAFQTANQLTVDGDAGPQTLAKLGMAGEQNSTPEPTPGNPTRQDPVRTANGDAMAAGQAGAANAQGTTTNTTTSGIDADVNAGIGYEVERVLTSRGTTTNINVSRNRDKPYVIGRVGGGKMAKIYGPVDLLQQYYPDLPITNPNAPPLPQQRPEVAPSIDTDSVPVPQARPAPGDAEQPLGDPLGGEPPTGPGGDQALPQAAQGQAPKADPENDVAANEPGGQTEPEVTAAQGQAPTADPENDVAANEPGGQTERNRFDLEQLEADIAGIPDLAGSQKIYDNKTKYGPFQQWLIDNIETHRAHYRDWKSKTDTPTQPTNNSMILTYFFENQDRYAEFRRWYEQNQSIYTQQDTGAGVVAGDTNAGGQEPETATLAKPVPPTDTDQDQTAASRPEPITPTFTGTWETDLDQFYRSAMTAEDAQALVDAISLEGKSATDLIGVDAQNVKRLLSRINNGRIPDNEEYPQSGEILGSEQREAIAQILRDYSAADGPLYTAARETTRTTSATPADTSGAESNDDIPDPSSDPEDGPFGDVDQSTADIATGGDQELGIEDPFGEPEQSTVDVATGSQDADEVFGIDTNPIVIDAVDAINKAFYGNRGERRNRKTKIRDALETLSDFKGEERAAVFDAIVSQSEEGEAKFLKDLAEVFDDMGADRRFIEDFLQDTNFKVIRNPSAAGRMFNPILITRDSPANESIRRLTTLAGIA